MEIKAVIVDDEKHSRETLKNLVEQFCDGISIVATAASIKDGLEQIGKLNPDLVFLDIELQSGTGFDLLEQVGEINFEVIFTTAFEQYAIKAVKFSSLDYLLKPIDVEELQSAVKKLHQKETTKEYQQQIKILIENLKQQPKLNKICLSTALGFEFIDVSEIIYCNASGSYTSFVLKNGSKFLVSKHLKEYENLLIEHFFMRVHNSFLINLKEVKKFIKADGGYIIMSNNDSVSLSRSKKDGFLTAMQHLVN